MCDRSATPFTVTLLCNRMALASLCLSTPLSLWLTETLENPTTALLVFRSFTRLPFSLFTLPSRALTRTCEEASLPNRNATPPREGGESECAAVLSSAGHETAAASS